MQDIAGSRWTTQRVDVTASSSRIVTGTEIGFRSIRFHDLRHTATTLMIAKGVDVKTVKEICGHADISTTTNYVYLIQGSVNKVAKTFSIEPELTATATPPTLKVVQSN